jgi:pyruvate dehydrogenase E1 component beta subunit
MVFRAWLRPSNADGLGHIGAHPLLIRCPWLNVVVPSSVRDAVSMFRAALASAAPVLMLEHAWLLSTQGEYPPQDVRDSPHKARVLAPGADIALIAIGACAEAALQAASQLKERQISAEVIDLRSLSPIDNETIVNSVRKSGRLLLIEGEYHTLGAGAEIAAFLAEHALDELDAPIIRLGAENARVEDIVGAALEMLGLEEARAGQ